MENRWHRAEVTLMDFGQRNNTISVYVHYDILNWIFGVRGEVDCCWYDLSIACGPFCVSFCFWREWPARTTNVDR